MGKIDKLISNALLSRRAVLMPRVGTLWVERVSASKEIDGEITPPVNKVRFTSKQHPGEVSVIMMLEAMGEDGAEQYEKWLRKMRTTQGIAIRDVGELKSNRFFTEDIFEKQLNPVEMEGNLKPVVAVSTDAPTDISTAAQVDSYAGAPYVSATNAATDAAPVVDPTEDPAAVPDNDYIPDDYLADYLADDTMLVDTRDFHTPPPARKTRQPWTRQERGWLGVIIVSVVVLLAGWLMWYYQDGVGDGTGAKPRREKPTAAQTAQEPVISQGAVEASGPEDESDDTSQSTRETTIAAEKATGKSAAGSFDRYMVVGGMFVVPGNADKYIAEMRRHFPDLDYVKHPYGSGTLVSVGSAPDRTEAQRTRNSIARQTGHYDMWVYDSGKNR